MPNQTYGKHIPFVINRSSACRNCVVRLFAGCSRPIRITAAILHNGVCRRIPQSRLQDREPVCMTT